MSQKVQIDDRNLKYCQKIEPYVESFYAWNGIGQRKRSANSTVERKVYGHLFHFKKQPVWTQISYQILKVLKKYWKGRMCRDYL